MAVLEQWTDNDRNNNNNIYFLFVSFSHHSTHETFLSPTQLNGQWLNECIANFHQTTHSYSPAFRWAPFSFTNSLASRIIYFVQLPIYMQLCHTATTNK